MYTNQQGNKVSVEEMQMLAQEAEVSVEVYAKAAGYSLQLEDVTKDPEPKIKDGDLLDPNFQQGAAADAGVVQPMTASQSENVAIEDTELPSADTSLDLPDPAPRFIQFKSKGDRPGAIVYEDTYLETKAGQPGYPDTFDEYAAAFNTTPQNSSTEEISIKATSNEKVFESLADSFKGISQNQDTGSFDSSSLSNLDNKELFNQEEEVNRQTLNMKFSGSGVDFEETDIVQEGDVNAVLGSEALRARIKNPETGEYIYSEILELESDGSFMNNDKIEKFLNENRSYLDLPKWTRSKNKMISKYKQWKNSELDPIINKARVEAEQAYIINPDLFKPYDKKINVGGYNTSTTVIETINPYQKEIAQEVNRLERKGVKGDLEAKAKINVRQNLKQADINEAIRETRAKFINAASNKEKAQAFLYASETFVKKEEAKTYNKNNEGAQIAAEAISEAVKKQQTVIDAFSATPSKNQSVDDFIIQQKNKLQPIIEEFAIKISEDPKEKINSPKLNMLLGLDEEVMLPKRFVDIMTSLENVKNSNISVYKDKNIKMTESIGKISDIDIAMEATAKNYELAEKYAINVGLGFQDIAVNVGMLGLNVLSLGQSEKVAELGSNYVEYTNEIRNSYQRDVSFDEAFSTPENTTKFIFQEVTNQIPILGAMMASGGAAAYVIGASSAGGKMMDMQNEIATGTAEYSPLKLWGTSLGYGVAEGFFAQISTVASLRRAKLNWMNGGKESVVNNSMKIYAKKQAPGLIYEPISEALGEAATVGVQNLLDGNPFMQGMDHASTSGLAFGFAFAAIPFLKGMYNSQFSTYETRSEIRTMQKELDVLNKELNLNLFTNPNLSDKSKSILKGKQNLLKQSIEEKSIQLADKIKQQEVIVTNNLTEGSKNEVVNIINKQARLERQAIEIQENPNISNKERAKLIAEIKADYDFTVKQRNEAVKDETMLKNGTEWAAFKGLNRSESQEYLDTADAMLSGERNGKQASKEDINDRAYDLYFGDKIRIENKKLGRSNSSLFKNFKSFDTVDEAIKEVNNDDTIAAEDKKETIQALKNGNDGYWNPASSTMVAIVENQVKNQRKYTKTHEVGHKAFEMLLGNPKNNAAFKGISDQLLSTLKATDRKTYDKFIKDGINDDAGNIDPTEVISRFMEYVADDQITNVQKAKGISGLFGVMIQKTFGSDYKFDFRGEQDIFNFVVGLGKKLKDGTLTTADIKKAKESKVIKDLPTSDTTTTTDKGVSFSKQSKSIPEYTVTKEDWGKSKFPFEKLKNSEFKVKIAGQGKYRKYMFFWKEDGKGDWEAGEMKRQLRSALTAIAKRKLPIEDNVKFSKAPLLDKINSLVPPSITTQEEYFSPKIFNEVFKATEEGGAISNYIKSKASSKEAGIKTIKSIQERLTNYDPAAERKKAGNKEPITFGEFIFSNTPFAIRDAKKALFKESEAAKKKADLDSKEVQGKTTEEDSGPTADTRKKYKSLISNPKLIPSFISSEIKTKLANVASKLKSKLSDRPKGKNAQTTPLVAEIKKAIGNVVKDPKALPKQIINRMGNPKDGSYQKFLIDNKKSILENMTTTYLQSAIPAAVEKSVGGAYVLDKNGKRKKDSNNNDIFDPKFVPYPEWVGKEIDREKVSTNKKGGTSGNQIVRRAIQVEVDGRFEDSITDEDFVANFVGSDGKVIRGKRESLGKALAEEAGFEVFVSELKNDKVVTQKDLDEDVIGQFEGKQAGDFVSDVRQEFKDNQEALGEILGDDTVALVSRDIERGTVKFSKGKRQALTEIANAKSSKQVNKIIGIEKQAINNKNRIEKQKEFEGIITKYNLSLEAFDAGALKNSGAIRTRPGKSDPDANKLNKWLAANPEIKSSPTEVWYALSNGDWIKGKKKIQDGKDIVYNLPSLEDIAKVGDGNATLIANTNRLYYGSSDPAYIAARKLAAKNSVDASVYKTGRVTTDFFGVKAIEKFKQNMLLMERVAYELQDAVAAGMPKEIAAMIIEGGYQATSGFIKIAAGFKYKSKVFEYALSGKPNQTRGKKYREEHNPPASTVGGTLLWAIVNNQVADVMPYVKKNYYQTQLSVKDDAKIDAAGLDGTLPEGYSLLNDPVIRLIKSGIGLSSLIDPNTGISMAQEYGVKVDDSALQLQPDVIEKQGELVERQLTDPKFTKKDSQKFIDQFIKLAPALNKANIINNKKLAYPFKEKVTTKKLLDRSNTIQKAINNGRSIKFSSAPKKIRVFDFDDTLARTKSNVLYTMPGEVPIYHGGSISSIKNITGSFVYFSQDQSQASEYAKGNDGEVKGFTLNESDIASEEDVFKVIRELGIQPKEKGWTVSDSRLYELIDDRFEQSFSKSDLSKLTKALANKGIKASRFTDSDLKSGKDTDNIVVFDKKSIKEQAKIDAATFAKDAGKMEAEGAIFDFSEFSKVMDGKKGPLFEVAKKIADARGTEDVFVLTARPQDAAGPIQEFLAELGLDIPLENITGLADGDPKAKANWMVEKVADGYNDFYFADDHLGNVKAVKDVFNTFDVKGKVQQAKIKFSKGLDKGFNDMIERQTGTESFKEFSKGVAQRRGKKVGKFKIFVSPSAEDFRGLTQYKFAGKGKQGEADQKFFEEALMDPYFKGVAAVEAARETIKNDTKALFKIFKPVKKKLNKLVPGIDFTYDGAVRVYLWNKAGIEIPGLTKRDNKKLNDAIANDPELSAFADALLLVSKQDTWPAPTEYWEAKTTLSDLNTLTEKTNRKEYLTEFIENVDIIFSEKNLNKVEALYGKASRVAIENAIYAMKTGSNSPNQSGDGITNRWLNWVNNSIGTIMFFNRRSALLQLTSATNFLNWSDNNPAKAALAFANQPQYWKDWAMIFNSDKLKQRRSGLKSDVQESEIANAAKNTEDKIGSIIAYLLKIGFSPTQIADSIAISSGGATFYRNRVNTYKKQGLDVKEAETKAFEDMSKLSDEAQQSGDPALVSQQQRSVAGRLILSFQNTTMQYTRLMKKAGQDLINGRGDAKTHVSKILYYGALQNFIFNALSQTAFALIPGFDDEEEEDKVKRDEKLEEKASRVLNGMTDSIIRGTGIYGAVVTTLKNTFNTWEREADKGFMGDQAKTILEAANISPAIGSKLRKIYSAIQAYQFDKAVMEKHPWSVTIDGKFNPSATYSVIGNLASATLNLPLDRALAEARGVAEMFDNRNSEMQRIALALGWRTWNVGAENEEFDLIKMEAKQAKKDKKAEEKAQYKSYLRRVGSKLSLEEANAYRRLKNAKLKKEYILKIGKEKGIN